MPCGYIIALVTITNPTQYEEYKRWSSEAMRAHGAEICVRGDGWRCWRATGTRAAP